MVALTKSSLITATVGVVCLLAGAIGRAETMLLDFSSTSCAPCQEMRPTIERLVAAGYQVRHVDIAREPALAAQFKVDQVPTFISLVDGREYARMEGKGSYEELQQILTPRATVRGQSPDAMQSQPMAQLASVNTTSAAVPTYSGLETPQAGRIIELEDPNRPPARSTPVASNPFGAPAPVQNPATSANHGKLIEATIKIAVEDSAGTSNGTGTIVDAREGAALILTCGHIFRESAGKGSIAITFYQATPTGAQPRETVAGQVLNYDLERDLALVVVRPQAPVNAIAIAPANTPLNPGAAVTTAGCNGGANPTPIDSQITTIDRYQGPPNVEVAGAPVEGRSGGGLFNAAGQLIGVCFAADPQSNEGLYASLPSIQAKLDSLNLAMVYQTPSAQVAATPASPAPASAPPVNVAIRGQDELVDRLPDAFPSPPAPVTQQVLSSSEQAALDEIKRRGLKSEVICIIRPHDPEGKSEVITLNSVSPDFVNHLADPAAAASRSPATAAAGQMLR
jgi:thiol-disulfide isomerase/thioredoxin